MKNEYITRSDHGVVVISTRQGVEHVIVDLDTLELMKEYDRWVIFKDRKLVPRIRSGADSGQKFLHKLLVPDLPKRASVGFKNHDPLDLRRENLLILHPNGEVEEAFPTVETLEEREVEANKPRPIVAIVGGVDPLRTEHLVRQSMQQAAEVKAQMEEEARTKPKKKGSEKKRRYSGVYWHKKAKKWHASVFWKGKRRSVGYFDKDDYDLAVRAAEHYRKYGPYNTNIPKGDDK